MAVSIVFRNSNWWKGEKWVDVHLTVNVNNFLAISECLIHIFMNYMTYCKSLKNG
jgi:hypothetical protein